MKSKKRLKFTNRYLLYFENDERNQYYGENKIFKGYILLKLGDKNMAIK